MGFHRWRRALAGGLVALLVGAGVAAAAQVREVDVAYPQVSWDLEHAAEVNQALRDRALSLIAELAEFGDVVGGYEVHLEEADLFSATMEYSGFAERMAHPMHARASVTADLRSGEVLTLADLFDDERYIDVLSNAVARRIEDEDLPTLVEFTRISPDQAFYLRDDALVLYFQLYELVPYAWGFPEFEIPLGDLREHVRDGSPIARLLAAEAE